MSVVCFIAAGMVWDADWAWSLPAAYVGLSFGAMATAYLVLGPWVLLKRPDGRRGPLAWLIFGPHLLLNGAAFALYRWTTRDPAYAQIPGVPWLSFGRRLSASEARRLAPTRVLDLAAEFEETAALRALPGYQSLPLLDATAPTEAELASAVEWIGAESGSVYVHCILGHSRSACVVIAYLMAIGAVATPEEGESLLRGLRPGVGLNAEQRGRLRGWEA